MNGYMRMFPEAASPHSDADLISLAAVMVNDPLDPGPLEPPAVSLISGLLYLAQFLDHDLTLDRTPLANAAAIPVEKRVNYHSPFLDLESLYGGGPCLAPFLYHLPASAPGQGKLHPGQERFLLGQTFPSRRNLDMPRTSVGRPILAEPRNEENLILAQLHVVWLRFHNRIMRALEAGEVARENPEQSIFAEAQRLVTLHYQYLVLNELLFILLDRKILARALDEAPALAAVPVEFTLAAFRAGHSMVRSSYRLNDAHPRASLQQILGLNSLTAPDLQALPDEWVIQWWRFFDGFGAVSTDEQNRSHGLEPLVAKTLHKLPFSVKIEGGLRPRTIDSLPALTLLRGARSNLPSGQDVSRALGLDPLSSEEILGRLKGNASEVFRRCGFLENTPLWVYILLEAAVRKQKQGLGVIGSYIVGWSIVGLLKGDENSILRTYRGWTPPRWTNGRRVDRMGTLARIALE